MPRRLAASLSLLAFAVCLIAGMGAQNAMATVLSRALVAMAGTMVISLVVGTMAQRMIEESLRRKEQDLRDAAAAAATTAATGATDAPPAGGPTGAASTAARNPVAKPPAAGR